VGNLRGLGQHLSEMSGKNEVKSVKTAASRDQASITLLLQQAV
jgi:hypothetical protein